MDAHGEGKDEQENAERQDDPQERGCGGLAGEQDPRRRERDHHEQDSQAAGEKAAPGATVHR